MIFIAGVFVPIEALPLQVRVISYLTPLTYMIDALRDAMIAPSPMYAVDPAALLTWFVVLQALAIIVLNRKTQF